MRLLEREDEEGRCEVVERAEREHERPHMVRARRQRALRRLVGDHQRADVTPQDARRLPAQRASAPAPCAAARAVAGSGRGLTSLKMAEEQKVR